MTAFLTLDERMGLKHVAAATGQVTRILACQHGCEPRQLARDVRHGVGTPL
jgi:hypothetical protein